MLQLNSLNEEMEKIENEERWRKKNKWRKINIPVRCAKTGLSLKRNTAFFYIILKYSTMPLIWYLICYNSISRSNMEFIYVISVIPPPHFFFQKIFQPLQIRGLFDGKQIVFFYILLKFPTLLSLPLPLLIRNAPVYSGLKSTYK